MAVEATNQLLYPKKKKVQEQKLYLTRYQTANTGERKSTTTQF